jgi:hypothetical protein
MALEGDDLKIERAFWSCWIIENWDDVRHVGDWLKYEWHPHWIRRVEFRPNSYGDTPYRMIAAQIIDGEVIFWTC